MTDTRSTPLDASQAGQAATAAATTVDGWFRGSINIALHQAMFAGPYGSLTEAKRQRLQRELERILSVAERSGLGWRDEQS
jgi:hypothetical protein